MSEALNTPVASCPGCGAPIAFKVGSSRVVVCSHCRSAVARTDRGLETIGKVADLVPTGARLALGLEGSYEGTRFELLGRIQMEWQQGVWDEWYAGFADGRFAWIAEAQGRYTVTFPVSSRAAPPFDALKPDRAVSLERLGRFVVADLEQARYVAAMGELPEPIPLDGAPVASADLSARDGSFATIDYSDPDEPRIYVGKEVPLEALGLAGAAAAPPPEPRIRAERLSCPHCGGSIALQAPDHSERVTCPSCSSLLDVRQGGLAYLKTLEKRKIAFQLGSKARFFGVDSLLIGWLRRTCRIEGTEYAWEEYLLYDEKTAGFRFLVNSAGHWSFVEPVPAGEVEKGQRGVTWKGRYFKLFSQTEATVSHVLGEFYWKVEVGETVRAVDYVSPPDGLSSERSQHEIDWSHAVYLRPDEVQAAFGSKEPLPAPEGVGMMQPNPQLAAFHSVKHWAVLGLGAALVLYLLAFFTGRHEVYSGSLGAPPPAALGGASGPGAPPEPAADHAPTAEQPWAGTVTFSEPFQVKQRGNLQIELESSVDNTWAFMGGELVRNDASAFHEFYVETSYYHGVEDGESWSEGSRTADTFVGSVEPGEYVLRAELGWEPNPSRPSMSVRVTSGVPRCGHFLFVALLLAGFPALLWLRASAFEKARWEESDVGE